MLQGYQYYSQGGSVNRSGGSSSGVPYPSGIASVPMPNAATVLPNGAGVMLPNGQVALVRRISLSCLVACTMHACILPFPQANPAWHITIRPGPLAFERKAL